VHLGLRLLFAFLAITGVAAFFVLRVFVTEIKPSVREVMEDLMVDTANLLAEVAAPDPVIVVGLGLNVTLTADEAPDPRATSLLLLGSTMLDRSALLGSVLAELTMRIDRLRAAGGPDATLVADYRSRSLTLGTRVRVTLPGDREIIGLATDLDESGQLSIDTGAQTVTVSAGDITHLRPAAD